MTYFVMEILNGKTKGRIGSLRTAGSKQCILEQHMDMIAEMQSVLQFKGVGVAKVHGETLYDYWLQDNPGVRGVFGPFQSAIISWVGKS